MQIGKLVSVATATVIAGLAIAVVVYVCHARYLTRVEADEAVIRGRECALMEREGRTGRLESFVQRCPAPRTLPLRIVSSDEAEPVGTNEYRYVRIEARTQAGEGYAI